MHRRILAKRMGASGARKFASIIFAWIYRTQMGVLSKPIRLRPRKPSPMAMWWHSISLGGVPRSILYDNLWTPPPTQGDLLPSAGVGCANLFGLLVERS